MKIVTLLENTACCEDLACEHGLSLYIETQNCKILFDAGQSDAFGNNARKLGVDLGAVDVAVLSHGHYDHGGGLECFLERNSKAEVYVNPYAFQPHYRGTEKYIGLDPKLQNSNRLRSAQGVTKIGEGLTLTSCLPLKMPIDPAGLTVWEGGVLHPEDFRHEQYLLVEEQGKRILFSGCSHKGILNIADHFRPDILIGGFHFMKVQDEAFLRRAAEKLMEYDTVYYTGHCTGQMQYHCMKEVMGDRLHALSTGLILEV